MITPSTHSNLSLLFSNQNKALAEILKQATPEQLIQFKENKDLKSVLYSLFQDKIDNSKSNALLLDLLKNSPVFKNMGNFTDNLKLLLTDLKSNPSLELQSEKLLNTIQTTTELDTPILKEKIGNSGVFMESKISLLLDASDSYVEEEMGKDVKSLLLALDETLESMKSPENENLQAKIDALITHIDYHQLLSHLNGSNSLYFPFAWDGLEKGSLEFKKKKEEKFYCEIHLTLKEYGKIDLFMGLYEENQLDIHVRTEKSELKLLLETHLRILRSLLTDAGLILRNIRMYEEEEERAFGPSSAYAPDEPDTQAGFEIKV